MTPYRSHYAEIVARILPARVTASQQQSSNESASASEDTKRSYNVLIFTKLDIPGIDRPSTPPSGQPSSIAGLPFVGKERITVRWSHYQEYLAAFVEGEKAFHYMRERLLEALTPGLESLFSEPLPTDQPVRLWWDCETPELDDLPWELATYGLRNSPSERFLFVRGLPPETPVPLLPIGDRLRLALLHQPRFTPTGLLNSLHALPPGIEVIEMTEEPRKALEQVTREGYELIHIVADGIVSLAFEGILYFHGLGAYDSSQQAGALDSRAQQLSPGELSSILRNCRASILSLSEQDCSDPDYIPMANRLVPSVYRAFAYLGSSRLPLPSVVAPLGPIVSHQVEGFWAKFYTNLADSLSLQQAFTHAQAGMPPLPMAVFLRHPYDVLFKRTPFGTPAPEVDPSHLGAALQLSHELVEQLKVHIELYGSLPPGISEFLDSEKKRQESLSAKLDEWLNPEVDA